MFGRHGRENHRCIQARQGNDRSRPKCQKIVNRTSNTEASGVEILKHLEYLYHSTEYIKQLPFVPRHPFTGLRKKRRPEISVPFAIYPISGLMIFSEI